MLRPAVLLLLTLASLACGPRQGTRFVEDQDPAAVRVAVDRAELGSSLDRPSDLIFRVYAVRGNARGEQVGADIKREVDPSADEYVLKSMPIGLHEIELTVLDDLGATIGQGTVRHLITSGMSRTEKVTIKRNVTTPRLVDLPLSVRLVLPKENPPTVSSVTLAWRLKYMEKSGAIELDFKKATERAPSYQEIKGIIDANCAGCHTDGGHFGGLALDRFPFTSLVRSDAREIFAVFMERVQNAENPMPPSGLLPDQDLELLRRWQDASFPYTSAKPQDGWRGKLVDLILGDELRVGVTVRDEAGETLVEKALEPEIVGHKMSLDLEIEVP